MIRTLGKTLSKNNNGEQEKRLTDQETVNSVSYAGSFLFYFVLAIEYFYIVSSSVKDWWQKCEFQPLHFFCIDLFVYVIAGVIAPLNIRGPHVSASFLFHSERFLTSVGEALYVRDALCFTLTGKRPFASYLTCILSLFFHHVRCIFP